MIIYIISEWYSNASPRAIEFLFLLKQSWLSNLEDIVLLYKNSWQRSFLKVSDKIQIYARAIEVEPSVKVAGMPAA